MFARPFFVLREGGFPMTHHGLRKKLSAIHLSEPHPPAFQEVLHSQFVQHNGTAPTSLEPMKNYFHLPLLDA